MLVYSSSVPVLQIAPTTVNQEVDGEPVLQISPGSIISGSPPKFVVIVAIMPYRLDIPGWMDEADLRAIETLAASVPRNGLVIEVGSFLGRSTWAWCKSVHPSVRVMAIDTFGWLPEFGAWQMAGTPYDRSLGVEDMFDANTADCDNLTKVKGKSLAVQLPRTGADLIFIDGDHQLPTVALDLGYYYSAVKIGGVLSGDDYKGDEPDVILSVDTIADALGKKVQRAGSKLWLITL